MTPAEVAELCVCFWLAPAHVRAGYRTDWLVARLAWVGLDAAEAKAQMEAARALFEVAP